MGKFIVKQTDTGYKFDLAAGNGETIATSEVYTTEAACLGGIESVVKCAAVAEVEDQTAEEIETGQRELWTSGYHLHVLPSPSWVNIRPCSLCNTAWHGI